MCRRVVCRSCQKYTYSGCGMHVEQVLAGVPDARRCRCRDGVRTGPAGRPGGLLRRLFGRR